MEAQANAMENNFEKGFKTNFSQNRIKRQSENKTSKTGNKPCIDSTRLCTFYYPDHPDILKATKSPTNTYSKKTIEKVVAGPVAHLRIAKNKTFLITLWAVYI